MVSGAQGGDVYAGDTEARLRAAFEEAAESTRTNPRKPVIVFIDEIVRRVCVISSSPTDTVLEGRDVPEPN